MGAAARTWLVVQLVRCACHLAVVIPTSRSTWHRPTTAPLLGTVPAQRVLLASARPVNGVQCRRARARNSRRPCTCCSRRPPSFQNTRKNPRVPLFSNLPSRTPLKMISRSPAEMAIFLILFVSKPRSRYITTRCREWFLTGMLQHHGNSTARYCGGLASVETQLKTIRSTNGLNSQRSSRVVPTPLRKRSVLAILACRWSAMEQSAPQQ